MDFMLPCAAGLQNINAGQGEKSAGTTQNAAGSKKRPQEMPKVTQDG
jgi:hypothetical protein